MSLPKELPLKRRTWGLSLDEWAVVAALVLAFLVRVGILKRVPW